MKTTTSALGFLVTGLLALSSSAPAFAGEPARSMAALEERVNPGTEVDIVDGEGRSVRGGFVRADDGGVLVTLPGRAEGRRVAAGDIMTVTRAGDSLKNGALIGLGVGALTVLAVYADETGSGCYSDSCKAAISAFAILAYPAIGAVIDRAIKGRTVVYRAPTDRMSWSVTPHPVPHGAGLQFALKF